MNYRKFWIVKCSGNEWIEYDEPMTLDWTICKKIEVIEVAALDRSIELLKEQRPDHTRDCKLHRDIVDDRECECGFDKVDEFLWSLETGEG